MHLEKTVQGLHAQLADSQHKANNLAHILRAHERKHQCEALYAEGRIIDAAESLLEIANAVSEDMKANKLLMDWLAGELRGQVLEAIIQFTIRVYEPVHIDAGINRGRGIERREI
jgi:hydrogenase maturation factor HypF (carbamoyltransferase family)